MAQVIGCCVYDKPQKNMQHMHGNIPYLFDFWADLVVHLLLQKSYITLTTPHDSHLLWRWGATKVDDTLITKQTNTLDFIFV